MSDNLELEVKQILSRLTGLGIEEISDGADVINDLGIDSLKIIEIATEIERTYKVAVKDSELVKPVLIEKGDTIELTILKNGITIEMKGKALNSGCEKEEIGFKLSTGKVVKGKITSFKKADIIL